MTHSMIPAACMEKKCRKKRQPRFREKFPRLRKGGKIRPPSHRVLALSHLACIVPGDCQEGSRLFTVNPLFRIMTKIAKSTFITGAGTPGQFYSLPALAENGYPRLNRLPVSIRIVLESLLRNCDGLKVTEKDVDNLASWNANNPGSYEIPFTVARIVLQDLTGVPLLVDLAAMRSAVAGLGKDASVIEPLVPVDLVVDHSVQVDWAGCTDALEKNLDIEFQRNAERYEFLKWGQQAFQTFSVVPPSVGIVHQVNLEYLAQGVMEKDGVYFPDTLVGTDSHTTMINGIGVVGWGVGGIEAEAGDARPARHVPGAGSSRRPYDGRTPRRSDRHGPGAACHPDAAQPRRRRQICGILRRRGGGPSSGRPGYRSKHGPGIRRHHGLFPHG